MLSELIPFGEWMPDQAPLMNKGVVEALNVIPSETDYKPFKTLQGSVPTLPGRCRGGISFISDAGVAETFAATVDRIYRLVANAWIDVTRALGIYATPGETYWKFVNYGNRVIATNYADDMQTFEVGTDSAFVKLQGGASAGHAPRAKFITIVGQFLMTLNIVDFDDGTKGARAKWSGLDDLFYWADSTTDDLVDAQKQSDAQDILGDYGLGFGLVSLRDYAVAVMNKAIVRLTPVGAPTYFDVETVQFERGTKVPYSVISSGSGVYFLEESGFTRFDGSDCQSIGDGKIDEYFYSTVAKAALWKTLGVVDRKNKFVGWLFQSKFAQNDRPDKLILYSEIHNKWTHADVNSDYLFSGLSKSMTLEEVGALYPDLDVDVPYSLDSAAWVGGYNLLSGFDVDNKLGVFEGPNAEAIIETAEARINPTGMALAQGVLPMVDTANCFVSIGHRKHISEEVTYTNEINSNDETGLADILIENRYMRARIRIPAGETWKKAQGACFDVEKGSGI